MTTIKNVSARLAAVASPQGAPDSSPCRRLAAMASFEEKTSKAY